MKRFILLTAALATLVSTGAAVANLRSSDVSQVNATFSATTASHLQTRTLTCEGGQTLEISTGRYTGTSTGSTADLSGPVELRVSSVYNTTRKLGWVEGRLTVAAADDRTHARFTATNVDGKLDGWLQGSAGHRDGSLIGSFSGAFTTAAGLTGGQLGTGTGTNSALLVKHADCRSANTTRPSVFLTVRGQVDALLATSISVKPSDGGASQACTFTRKPERIEAGDRVEMTCAQVGGAWTLVKVKKRG